MNQQVFQVQVPIGNLPINLILVGNSEQGSVAFIRVANSSVIVEPPAEGKVSATIYGDHIVMTKDGNTDTYFFNTVYDYKHLPLMLEWLKQQNLQEPNVIFR